MATSPNSPVAAVSPAPAAGVSSVIPSISFGGIDLGENGDLLEILLGLTVLALLPSILIMMTSFTRIVIVLSCLRNAIGLQQTPPNQVLVGIALFLSLFIMSPVIGEINETAYQPYERGGDHPDTGDGKGGRAVRSFMLKNTNAQDLNLFLELGNTSSPNPTTRSTSR
jgi:flagellar biosynthetic protein FliP